MRIAKLFLTSAFFFSMALSAFADPKDEVMLAFKAWQEATIKGDAQPIASLFSPEAVVMVPNEPTIFATKDQLIKYFTTMKRRPHLSLVLDEEYVRMLSDKSAMINGRYTVRYLELGSMQMYRRRFTFVYEKEKDDRWMIVGYSISNVPQKLR